MGRDVTNCNFPTKRQMRGEEVTMDIKYKRIGREWDNYVTEELRQRDFDVGKEIRKQRSEWRAYMNSYMNSYARAKHRACNYRMFKFYGSVAEEAWVAWKRNIAEIGSKVRVF